MALLVPNIGEQESLRYLVNHSHNTPRNLILKLLSSDTVTAWGGPTETDTPRSLRDIAFVEPYNYSAAAVAATSNIGYPPCDAPYANQYGKLLDGSNWTCTAAEGTNTTEATYPEQTFTFTGGPKYIHGYYVARANSIQQLYLNNATGTAVTTIQNASLTGTAFAATANGGPNGFPTNTLGSPYVQVQAAQSYTYSAGGGFNISTITTSTTPTGVTVGMYAIGTNIGPYARVTAVNGSTISLSVPSTGTPAGTISFYEGRWAQGQDITATTGIPASTTIVGYDPTVGMITLSQNANATVTGTVTASFKAISATAHGGIPGDVVYLSRGTSNTSLVAGSYVINHADANSFETIPALAQSPTVAGANVTIYDSIMFLERFTNGPYLIQNNGDQIKITLNVSLS